MEAASAGATIPRTRFDGQLVRLSDWSPNVAIYLANQQGIQLTDAHWDIIHLMRTYYQTYNISPIRKLLIKEIKEKFGKEKATDEYLSSLFPGDVMRQGILIAGIPSALLDSEMRDIDAQPTKSSVTKAMEIREITFANKTIQFYAKGNLVNLEDWSRELAEYLAEKENIKLTDEHWMVIHFLREFYQQYGIAPMVKLLVKHMKQQLGPEIGNNEYLYSLFPKGPARQGSRIAGLPEPQGCIDP